LQAQHEHYQKAVQADIDARTGEVHLAVETIKKQIEGQIIESSKLVHETQRSLASMFKRMATFEEKHEALAQDLQKVC
jgi:hypothetical protein